MVLPHKSKTKKRSYQRKYMTMRRSNIGSNNEPRIKYDNQENVRPGSEVADVKPVKYNNVTPFRNTFVTSFSIGLSR